MSGVGWIDALQLLDGIHTLLPVGEAHIMRVLQLLHMLLLRRAMGELNSELTHRADWSPVPLRGVLNLLRMSPGGGPAS